MKRLFLIVLVACSRPSEPESKPTPPAAQTATTAPSGGVGYTVPGSWTLDPTPKPMRKATYVIPRVAGDTEDTTLAISEAGGGVDANLDRWVSQFPTHDTTKRSEKTIGRFKVTLLEVHGTYTGGGAMGVPTPAKEKWTLLGAIVSQSESENATFFKLTGPDHTVESAKSGFSAMIDGLK